jgi:hypothetical protein
VEGSAVTVCLRGLQGRDEVEKMAFGLNRQSLQSSPDLGGGGTFMPDS